jgi:predicted small lipoprotein YifL
LRQDKASDEMIAMKTSSRLLTVPFAAIALLVFACGKPKQAEVPDAEKDVGGPDLAAEETATKPNEDKPATNEDLRAKCCASCKEGLAADRSGGAPDTIPCSDFTANLSPWCLEFFRANPTKASECK